MMVQVRDLLEFEDIKRVIDIDSDINSIDDARDLVNSFVIPADLKEHLLDIAMDLKKERHESIQIIGNYGSGKSHLLAVLSSIIDNPSLISDLQDEDLQEAFQASLNRKFAVVQFELQVGTAPLSYVFYDRLEVKLKEKYAITIPSINVAEVYDHKEELAKILAMIKEKDPSLGLVVIMDEISDFIKQKETKEAKHRDTQFMRVLAQVSNSMDFLFIGSMQENVFSSDEFLEEAESFGRTAQRYRIVTISKEDIKGVISRRVLKKNDSQMERLKGLLEEYGEQIPQVQNKLQEFIHLYPVHPYIIDIFSLLPYFENRGVIDFVSSETRNILKEEFPAFITYERIYDNIARNHSLRNLDEIRPVVEAVESLTAKKDLLREEMREDAERLVKALAVLKIYGRTTHHGARPEELTSELMIISEGISNTDRIRLLLEKLREVTDGQFIAKGRNEYYYIDLEHDIDYDVVINRKGENLFEGAKDQELLEVLLEIFDISSESSYERVFPDSCYWTQKKTYRFGSFVYDDGSSFVRKGAGDFNFVLVSPYREKTLLEGDETTACLNLNYNEELDSLLKKIAAITALKKSTSYPRDVMNRKQRDYTDILKKKLLKLLLESEIVHGGHNERAGHLFSLEPDTLSEYYYNVKQALFNDSFAKKYPQYPFLVNRLSPENIEKEIELTIKGIIFGKEEITSSNALNLLFSLGLLDSKKRLDTSTSIYIKEIISCLEKEEGKNVKVEGVFDILGGSPYGLEKELIQLLLVVLTYNGEINMRRKGGGLLTSSEIQHFFSTGMKRFHEIVYVALETEFPVENITQLFKILDMDPGLVKDNKTRTQAVVEFQRQALGMKKKIDKVFLDLNDFRNRPDVFINHDAILRKGQGLESIPIESFLRVKTVADFKRIALNKLQMEKLEIGLRFLQNIQDFLNDFRENIYERYLYVLASLDFVKKHACFFPGEALERLEEKAEGCKEILDNLSHILSFDERRILKGKMEQYQNDYQEIYSDAHRKTVGLEIEWDRLQEMKKSYQLKELFLLSRVLGIHTAPYSQIIFLINKLEQVECHLFRGSHLEREYTCPYCRFPDYQFEPHIMERILHINTTLHDLGEEILKVREDWQDQILQEMENYQDNCQLLSNKEQEVIKGIMEKQRLPEQVTEETVKALNNLFSELQEVEITPSSILEQLFSSSLILDFDTFEENLKNFKSWILSKGERKNIRIKLEKGE